MNVVFTLVCLSVCVCVCVCASCQFVVNDSYDYTVHAVDPDTLVEWDYIEQVVSALYCQMID